MNKTDNSGRSASMRGGLLLVLALLTVVAFDFSGRRNETSNLIDTVACPIGPAINNVGIAEAYFNKKVKLKIRLFYGANHLQRVWLDRKRPKELYRSFVQEINKCSTYGLNPGDYHIAKIEEAVKKLYESRKPDPAEISNLDIAITGSFFLYTTHLIEGRVRFPGATPYVWERGMPLENDIVLLLKMESAASLRRVIDDLQPKDPQYKRLQKALAEYRKLQALDTFPSVQGDLSVKPGEMNEEIPLVRKKLSLTDYHIHDVEQPAFYDDELLKAVRQFQQRHGLNADGILNAETVRFLNVPLQHKVKLIELNLERLRWYPHADNEKNKIIVNVPEYMLRVYRNNRERLEMRVVLGSDYNPTPVFHDTLKYIVFSPKWFVPQSIFETEFFPALQKDAAAFSSGRFRFYKNGIEVDPLAQRWSRQDTDPSAYSMIENPGEANSLGRVKFIMPNNFNIYLHDTPAAQLFAERERALSHGCIRLEKPAEFARYLLSDQKEWTKEKIEAAMRSPKPVQVDLKTSYPVYITYRTAWVDDNNLVNFREDIYGHDQRQLAHL